MCTKPLGRAEMFEVYINKQGTLSNRAKIISWTEYEANPNKYSTYKSVVPIPCGQCTECKLNKSREWANRIMLEKKCYREEECWFITLTYEDEYLPTHTYCNQETGEIIEGISLDKKDMTKFLKDLRRYYDYHYQVNGIRFYGAGEYGSITARPHYHIILFGLPLDQSKLKLYKHNELGQSLWNHEELTKIWGKGHVVVGRVTWESAAYVARYVMKKQTGQAVDWYYHAQGKIEPFVNMSRMPGIGKKYLMDHINEIKQTDTIPIANKKTAEMVPPPKYYDRFMEKLEPQFMEELKQERRKKAEELQKFKNLLTDLSPQEQREIKEKKLETRIKGLIRKEI